MVLKPMTCTESSHYWIEKPLYHLIGCGFVLSGLTVWGWFIHQNINFAPWVSSLAYQGLSWTWLLLELLACLPACCLFLRPSSYCCLSGKLLFYRHHIVTSHTKCFTYVLNTLLTSKMLCL